MTNGSGHPRYGMQPDALSARYADRVVPDVCLRKRYQELSKKYLNHALSRLFTELTGLRFHIAWVDLLGRFPAARDLRAGCAVSRHLGRLGTGRNRQCVACARQRSTAAMRAGLRGYRFTCQLGADNYWIPISVEEMTVGIAVIQRVTRRQQVRSPRGTGRELKPVSAAAFSRAMRLLRLMVHNTVESDMAEIEGVELRQVRHAVVEHEKEEARLRHELHRVLPSVSASVARVEPHTRANKSFTGSSTTSASISMSRSN